MHVAFMIGWVSAIAAIVLGLAGIARSDYLFHKLYQRARRARLDVFRQCETIFVSYAAFTRALQFMELDPKELSKDAAFALLTSYYVQQQLYPGSPELTKLRKTTRNQIEKRRLDMRRC